MDAAFLASDSLRDEKVKGAEGPPHLHETKAYLQLRPVKSLWEGRRRQGRRGLVCLGRRLSLNNFAHHT